MGRPPTPRGLPTSPPLRSRRTTAGARPTMATGRQRRRTHHGRRRGARRGRAHAQRASRHRPVGRESTRPGGQRGVQRVGTGARARQPRRRLPAARHGPRGLRPRAQPAARRRRVASARAQRRPGLFTRSRRGWPTTTGLARCSRRTAKTCQTPPRTPCGRASRRRRDGLHDTMAAGRRDDGRPRFRGGARRSRVGRPDAGARGPQPPHRTRYAARG